MNNINLIGVYFIKNTITQSYYVGHSKNIYNRFRSHKSYLRRNIHHCIPLQRSWNKYGESAFEFSIYKICSSENESISIEQSFIDQGINLFNTSKIAASGGDLLSNHPNKKEIINRIKNTTIANMTKLSIDDKKRKFGQPGTKNPMFGKTHSNFAKLKISLKNKGNIPVNKGKKLEDLVGLEHANEIKSKLSSLAKDRTGSKNSFYGKKHTSYSKNLIREKKLGNKPTNMRKVNIDSNIFESVTEAARQLNVSPATIIYRIRSTSKLYEHYSYLI
ncbi:MAG: GIY-YIG nuclease family protein [Clostridium sp.]